MGVRTGKGGAESVRQIPPCTSYLTSLDHEFLDLRFLGPGVDLTRDRLLFMFREKPANVY